LDHVSNIAFNVVALRCEKFICKTHFTMLQTVARPSSPSTVKQNVLVVHSLIAGYVLWSTLEPSLPSAHPHRSTRFRARARRDAMIDVES
jgi:hypothetical protein